ncbi:MAG: hypothetical protein K940chlam5_00859 [Candidatus Anoxychlamydiales bacterium]|nr:hypothetical protein [Candidatus Anoxychlamydiales bacterium]
MATCFKGLEWSSHDYKERELDEIYLDGSLCSDPFSGKQLSLIASPDGSKRWEILEIGPHKDKRLSIKEVEESFGPVVGEIRRDGSGLKAASLAYTAMPNLSEMEKSSLKTQLILGLSTVILGKTVGKMVLYAALGGGSGLIIGGAIGGVVGGALSGGPGVVPGAALGGLIGGAAGSGFGAGLAIGAGINDATEFYRDFQILKDVEEGSHHSIKTTCRIAEEYFLYYLDKHNKRERESDLFCSISLDIMLFPVITNCNHVFELLSITNLLKTDERCPQCRKRVKKLAFDFKTMAAIRTVVREALVELRESAGNPNLLLLQKQFKKTNFDHLDKITRAKIKHKTPLSLAEKRTLYHIFREYSKKFAEINKHMKDTIALILLETRNKGKIDMGKFDELNKKLQDYFE